MSAQRHIIGKQIIDIRLKSGHNAFEVQQQIATCAHKVWIPALALEFDQLVSTSEVRQIDRLEINLGVLDSDRLDQTNYLKALTDLLRKKLREAIAERKYESEKVSIEWHGFAQWLYFMQHGRLPWPAVALAEKWEQQVLATVAGSVRAMHQLNALWHKGEYVQKRFIQQHSEKFRASLLAAITGKKQDMLPKLLTKLWKALAAIEVNKWLRQAERPWREACWQLLMEVVIGQEKRYSHQQLLGMLMYRQVAVLNITENPLETFRKAYKESGDLINTLFSAQENEISEALIETQDILKDGHAYDRRKNGSEKKHKPQGKADLEAQVEDEVQADDSIVLTHAGVVLIHVFLPHLFSSLDWVEEDTFRNEACRHQAIHLVHYIATGSTEAPEHQLALEKVLCAHPLHKPVPRYVPLTQEALDEADRMLRVAIDRWGALGHASPDGLREGFFAREGRLTANDRRWTLQVAQNTLDILLDKLPWNLSMAKLPWMKKMMHVVWR